MHVIVLLAALSTVRQLVYPGADFGSRPIPKFDKGYLLFLGLSCNLTVHAPSGNLLFSKDLTPCGGLTDAAVDTDGTFAVSLSYLSPVGNAGAIARLDAAGRQTAFIETKRYLASGVGFDAKHTLWAIGWQRDEIRRDEGDTKDYMLVRRYSRAGVETGAFIPRSLWETTGEPAGVVLGHWHMAFAKDHVGAWVYPHYSHRTPQWVEWDLDGNLIARISIPDSVDGCSAFTSSGRLYTVLWDPKHKVSNLAVLERATRAWRVLAERNETLLGADGEDLVFTKNTGGPIELVWVRAPE